MGGYGSGRFGSGRKQTTDSMRQLNIRYLKAGLVPGMVGSITWPQDKGENAGIGFRTEENYILLGYSIQIDGKEAETIQQRIGLTRTPCHYGGTRTWFVCLQCGRRALILYFKWKQFYCRRCCGLAYSSQRESEPDRLMRKAGKIRKRLEADDGFLMPIWKKPKGMHQKTFDRLRMEADSASRLACLIMGQRFGVDMDFDNF